MQPPGKSSSVMVLCEHWMPALDPYDLFCLNLTNFIPGPALPNMFLVQATNAFISPILILDIELNI